MVRRTPDARQGQGKAYEMLHSDDRRDAGSTIMAHDTTATPLLALHVLLPDGRAHKVEAATGFNTMELIRAGGLPITAECGGAGVCATCHVQVPDAWADHLPPPTGDELARLDDIPTATERSRLCCQIQMTDALDGLSLELQADSTRARHLAAAE